MKVQLSGLKRPALELKHNLRGIFSFILSALLRTLTLSAAFGCQGVDGEGWLISLGPSLNTPPPETAIMSLGDRKQTRPCSLGGGEVGVGVGLSTD